MWLIEAVLFCMNNIHWVNTSVTVCIAGLKTSVYLNDHSLNLQDQIWSQTVYQRNALKTVVQLYVTAFEVFLF